MNEPPIKIEIANLKAMLATLEETEKNLLCDLFEIFRFDFCTLRDMNNETTQMLKGIFPWTKDVSEASHRASLRTELMANLANDRAKIMYDILEAVK